jgi:lysozyme family protein
LIEIAAYFYLALMCGAQAPHIDTCEWWEGENMALTQTMRDEYETKFATCTISRKAQPEAERVVVRSLKARPRYERVAAKTKVPWHVIAVIHNMECGGRFDCHLHNGDPLRRRTVNVPAGRPATGKAPFTWEESAIDALTYDGLSRWGDWSVAGTLYRLESYNGMGYRKRGVASPYLWSGSQHYTSGKFVADGKYDAKAVSTQVGAAVVLRDMQDQALVEMRPYAATPAPVWPLPGELAGLE